jgi:hypothetical protein
LIGRSLPSLSKLAASTILVLVAPSGRRTTLLPAALLPVTNTLSDHRLLPDRSLPPYSYVPGLFPHPESDPRGHSFETEHTQPTRPTEASWRECDEYLWGINLFNCGYYWEAHESWEQVWHACGRQGKIADFLKGLIKLAASGVKAREGVAAGIERHARRAYELFSGILDGADADSSFMGMCLTELLEIAKQIGENPQALINTSDQRVVRLMPFQLRVEGSPCRSN